ncbi:MAG TPA: hypothetical protein VFA43_25540 [Gemmatimonadaceae bacterium]|nr:hypothetical protein [Gemmatimonadaceae bacterium]
MRDRSDSSGDVSSRRGIEYYLKLTVVSQLEVLDLPHYLRIIGEYLAQPHERTHESNIHLDSEWTVQDTREHGDTLLGEGQHGIAPTTAARMLL